VQQAFQGVYELSASVGGLAIIKDKLRTQDIGFTNTEIQAALLTEHERKLKELKQGDDGD
jgi:hypothetical protein